MDRETVSSGTEWEFFADVRPACSMVEVQRLIDPAHLVEIEAVATVGD
ncbi:endoribonuclease L-PSP [Natrinema altunense JCM 12890]|uniref:Endoribonuclease L-PSP n=1 Tax=Natrinema altunense (strain JCM 12890 / CGMCC 1.3731 / AJ2) TaxID=1227494 RepID=L9ZNU9_NATA2|nr:endoribonuclease L-PSP [Natrinema altunense JCM 12890]